MSELGICSTCNHLDLCASRKNWIAPKIHCEEFDDSPPFQETGGQSSQPSHLDAAIPRKIYDFAPTTQHREVHQLHKEKIATYQQQLGKLIDEDVAAFNAQLKEADFPTVYVKTE